MQYNTNLPLPKLFISELFGWTSFLFMFSNNNEVIAWCNANLGRRYRGTVPNIIENWMGNWRIDISRESFLTISVYKPEQIALMKLRWL